MKKGPSFRIAAVTIIFTHLFMVCFRDISFAGPGPISKDASSDSIDFEKLGRVPDTVGHGSKQLPSPVTDSPSGKKSSSDNSLSGTFFQKDTSSSSNGFNRILESVSADLFTGSLKLNIPLSMPAGKRDILPPLNIAYSSSNANGLLGVGWSLELGLINRSLKKGVPKYDSSDVFTANSEELVGIGSSEYRNKIEGAFLKYTYDGTAWQAVDKSGTKYFFGSASGSRVTVSQGTFSWALDKILDTRGNYLSISYIQEENNLYPSTILYTANENTGLTSLGKVVFNYETRPDVSISYIIGARVKKEKRLSGIEVYFEDSLIRKYSFEYSKGGSTQRSLLSQVNQYGSDGTTALPAITFSYRSNAGGWSDDDSRWHIPDGDFIKSGQDQGRRVYDLNGDGRFDFIISRYDPDESSGRKWLRETHLNSQDGFNSEADWWPVPIGYFIYNSWDDGRRMVDLTGDGIPELLAATRWDPYNGSSGEYKTAYTFKYLDTSNPKWEKDEDWNLPDGFFVYGNKIDGGRRFADLNGDGLNDLSIAVDEIKWSYRSNDVVAKTTATYTNTGSTWKNDSTWDSPDGSYISSSGDNGRRLSDINGDGLADFMVAYNGYKATYLNNGAGWTKNDDFNLPDGDFAQDGLDQGRMLADINGDGLNDLVIARAGHKAAYLNTGSGWRADSSFNLPDGDFVDSEGKDQGRYLADLDGDGVIDLCVAKDGYKKSYLNSSSTPDLLTGVTNGLGGSSEIEYTSSTQYDSYYSNKTGKLPFALQVVSKITSSDGQGNEYSTSYSYKDGYFDSENREFRGFGYVKVTDVEGNYSESYFKQDSTYKGKLYKQETKDSSGNRYGKTENTYSSEQVYSGVNFVYLKEAASYIYDGGSSYKQTKVSYEYDDYGNPTKVFSYGDVSKTGDEKTQNTEYVYNSSNWIMGLPSRTKLLDQDSNVVSEKRFYYDNNSSYSSSPSQGLLSKEEAWFYNSISDDAKYIASTYTYDSRGNLSSSTNPLGYKTSFEYDTKSYSYPVKATNSLSQSVSTIYYGINDSNSDSIGGSGLAGQPKYVQDANGQKTYQIYDSLGRLTKVIGPIDSESSPGTIYEYDLSVQPIKIIAKQRLGSEYLTNYSFYDGLGRLIESKSPAQDGNKQIISGLVTYNERGQVQEKYLPYLSDSSSSFESPSYSGARFSFSYDPVGRLTQTTNPDSTYSSVSYNILSVTRTDENTHKQQEVYDVYGRITQVKEYNGSETYSTNYQYNIQNNLTEITDAKGNTTTITYDSLGRKIRMSDPDMGEWSYAYDDLGNLSQQTDALGQVIEFEYDQLARLTKKKVTSPESKTLASYSYDDSAKDYCVGRLSKVTDQNSTTEFYYDKLGRETKSTKTIYGSSYTVQREYDTLDRLTALTYPDNTKLNYQYSNQGVNKITNANTSKVCLKSVSYNAQGQITNLEYGNGVTTAYTYDTNTIRLKELKTETSGGESLQNLSYSFDNIGNVKQINDSVYSNTQSFEYDSLNRLTSAQGGYGSISYSYNSIGNILTNGDKSYSYSSDKPHAVSSLSDGTTFSYDENGNLETKTESDGTSINYTYDRENHLTKVSGDNSEESSPDKISLTLKAGWNFFSLAVIPDSLKIEDVFSGTSSNLGQVSRYNPEKEGFEHYVKDSDFDQFTSLEYGRGYQVYITGSSSVSLTVSGKAPSEQMTRSLKKGYNLIGCPSSETTPLNKALNNLQKNTDYSSVYEYYSESGKYITLGDEINISPGEAYFLKALKDTSWQLLYNQENASGTTNFTYDGDGGRITKEAASANGDKTTTNYIGSLYELEVESDLSRKHIYFGSAKLCSIDSSSNIYYYHSDHLGSSNIITDADGKKSSRYEYYPYGATYKSEGQDTTNYKYTGKEEDSSTGLYFYGARYYDPDIGRFTQPDTIVQSPYDPQSLNRYTYARNNPIIYTDPTGHWIWIAIIIGAVLGGASAAASGQPVWQGALMGAAGGLMVGAGAAAFGFWGAVGGGMVAGAGNASATGGNIGFGAIAGGLGAGLGYGLGSWASNWESGSFWGELGASAFAGAIGGGVGAELSGSSFGQGAGMGAAYGSAGFFGSKAVNSLDPRVRQTQRHQRESSARHALSLKKNDMIKIPVGSRSAVGPAGHKFLSDWEMGPGPGGKIYTSTKDLSKWDTQLSTQKAITSGNVRFTTTEVSASGLVEAIAWYEQNWVGQNYSPVSFNSNYAVNTVIYAAGGNVPGGIGFNPPLGNVPSSVFYPYVHQED